MQQLSPGAMNRAILEACGYELKGRGSGPILYGWLDPNGERARWSLPDGMQSDSILHWDEARAVVDAPDFSGDARWALKLVEAYDDLYIQRVDGTWEAGIWELTKAIPMLVMRHERLEVAICRAWLNAGLSAVIWFGPAHGSPEWQRDRRTAAEIISGTRRFWKIELQLRNNKK